MSDLVRRLRGYPGKRGMEKPFHVTMHEAADYIEKLEAALQDIIKRAEFPAPPNVEALKMFARKALEGKDD